MPRRRTLYIRRTAIFISVSFGFEETISKREVGDATRLADSKQNHKAYCNHLEQFTVILALCSGKRKGALNDIRGSCYSVGLRDNDLCVENSMRHHCPVCYEECTAKEERTKHELSSVHGFFGATTA